MSSLPREAQVKYWLLKNASHTSSRLAVDNIDSNKRDVALARYDLVAIYNDYVIKSEKESKVEAKAEFVNKYNSEKNRIYDKIGKTSWKTLERWKKILESHDYDAFALVPGGGRPRKRENFSHEMRRTVLACYLKPNQPRLSEAIREAHKILNKKGISCNASDMTIRRFVADYEKENADQVIFLRYGAKGRHGLNDTMIPDILRDYDKIEVGDILVADGHVLNFEIINPWTGKPKRMTLLMVWDMKTSIPMGWEIMPTENTQCIASAYRNALLRMGFAPKIFYLDNGRAFKAKFFTSKSDIEGMAGLFERLGSRVIHAWGHHGQSKPVERMFGTFGEIERQIPSYVGYDIAHQPARLNRGEKEHRSI